MSDGTEVVLRWAGAAAVIGLMLVVSVWDHWGDVWQREHKIRNPYARSGQHSILLLWVGAIALSIALAQGNYSGIWKVSVGLGFFAAMWGVLFGLAHLIGWTDERAGWVRKAVWWPIGLFVMWLLVLGLAADAQPDAPIIKARNLVAPWHWDEL